MTTLTCCCDRKLSVGLRTVPRSVLRHPRARSDLVDDGDTALDFATPKSLLQVLLIPLIYSPCVMQPKARLASVCSLHQPGGYYLSSVFY